jgi:hypothetical protein
LKKSPSVLLTLSKFLADVNSLKKTQITVLYVLVTESMLHLVNVQMVITKTQPTVNVKLVVTDVVPVLITVKLMLMNQVNTVVLHVVVLLTESICHSVYVQKDSMISKFLTVKLVDQNVLLVLLGTTVQNVKPQITILKTSCVIKIVVSASGLMMLKENVKTVTKPVPVVLYLKTTDVVVVSQVDTYMKDNVSLNVQITSSPKLTLNIEPVNHVPVHVNIVLLMITVTVNLVVKVLSYLTNSVNQVVQMDTIQIIKTESVLLVLMNVLLVMLTDPTETVLIVKLQTSSLTDGVVQIVQKNTIHSKT